MKKYIITFIITLFIVNLSFSQTGWIHQQSQTTKNLNNLFFINSMTGWCVGDSNTILRTINGGSEWDTQLFAGSYKLTSVHFVNENTGWCCGGITFPLNSGVIFKTTNSGNNWSVIDASGGAAYNRIYFVNANIGFVAVNSSYNFSSAGSILKTTNGGINWIGSYAGDCEFTSVKFKDINTG